MKGFATLELRGRYVPRYPPEGAQYLLEFPPGEREAEPVGLVYGGLGSASGVGAESPAVSASAAIHEEPAGEPLSEPSSEPDPPPSRVRPRPTRRRR